MIKKSRKPLTISFAEDPVVFLPTVNLNNVVIDLTENSPNVEPMEVEVEERVSRGKQREDKKKALTFSMELSSFAENRAMTTRSNQGRTIRAMARKNSNEYKTSQSGATRKVYEQLDEAAGMWAVEEQRAGPSYSRSRPSLTEPCYKKLLEMNNKPLIENYEGFDCILCGYNIGKGKGVILKDCLHSFCRPCLVRCIKNTPADKNGIVDCPDIPLKCDSCVSVEEIKALLGDDDYERYREHANSAGSLMPLLLQMDDLEVIPNHSAFECSVCFSDVGIGDGIVLKNCLHFGCKDCLAELIKHADEFEVRCPHIENGKNCSEFIQEREMRHLVSADIFDKHLKKSLKIAEHVNELNFHCRGLNCENFVELANPEITAFQCEICHQVNCVPCKAIHPGKKCQEYQEEVNPQLKDARLQNENKQSEDAIAADIAAGNAMLCPRCRIPVMKITGCDFITCTACKLGICWCTKKPRKEFKRANGEVVEGCKCREPPSNQRCHPKCGNCH